MLDKRPLEIALEVVQSEPELPGAMPEGMKEECRRDPERFCRAVVMATKVAIDRRLREAFNLKDTELYELIRQGPAVVYTSREEFLRLMALAGEDPKRLGNEPRNYTDTEVVELAQAIEAAAEQTDVDVQHANRSPGASASLVLALALIRMRDETPSKKVFPFEEECR